MDRTGSTYRVGVWALSILLAAVFLGAGVPKLVGKEFFPLAAAAMKDFPAWLRIVVGIVETAGAIMLLIPSLAMLGALALALLMLPATVTQLLSGEPGVWVPGLLLVLLVLVAWLRFPAAFEDLQKAVHPRAHPWLREGVIAGLLGATIVAVWFLIVDTVSGRPLFTPTVLGRALFSLLGPAPAGESATIAVIAYTIFHYGAFIIFGEIVAIVVNIAETEPSVLAGFLILFVAFEIGFHGLVALLQETTILGGLAWYNVMIGNLLAAGLMGAYMWRLHPHLKEEFEHALGGAP